MGVVGHHYRDVQVVVEVIVMTATSKDDIASGS